MGSPGWVYMETAIRLRIMRPHARALKVGAHGACDGRTPGTLALLFHAQWFDV